MLDIKWIRENPQKLDEALVKRNAEPLSEKLIALDLERRNHVAKVQVAQERRNSASKEIGQAMANGEAKRAEEIKNEVADLKVFLSTAESHGKELTAALEDALSRIPNVPFDDVPVGRDERDNVERHKVGKPPVFDFAPKEHFDIGEHLGQMDFDRASRLSGARFTVLSGQLARLERALGQFMLDVHTLEHGYREVSVPVLVLSLIHI